MGTDETFVQEATYSLDCAKQMLQKMSNGEQVPEPEMHDDLLVFYTTMFRHIQSYRFKTMVPPENKELVYSYIKTLEGMMFMKAMKNPKLQAQMMNLEYYPAFFELPAAVAPATPNEQMVQAAKQMDGMQTDEMVNTQQNIETANEQAATNQQT